MDNCVSTIHTVVAYFPRSQQWLMQWCNGWGVPEPASTSSTLEMLRTVLQRMPYNDWGAPEPVSHEYFCFKRGTVPLSQHAWNVQYGTIATAVQWLRNPRTRQSELFWPKGGTAVSLSDMFWPQKRYSTSIVARVKCSVRFYSDCSTMTEELQNPSVINVLTSKEVQQYLDRSTHAWNVQYGRYALR